MRGICILVFALVLAGSTPRSFAQDAAPPTVDLETRSDTEQPSASPSPTPLPTIPPDVPELSVLDEAFKKSSLGKTADEFRNRVEIRRLQNRVDHESNIVEAKEAAARARTDLEKRERLRDYYNIYYARVRALASSEDTRKAVDAVKADHLRQLEQPRVRPEPGGTVPPPPKKEKAKKKRSPFGG